MAASVVGLLAEAQLRALQKFEEKLGGSYMGLSVAARAARRAGLLSSCSSRRLERLDIAMHVARHTTVARLEAMLSDLAAELD